jgi:phenylacetate-CoA ligase
MVGAEAFPSVLRSEFRERGINALQSYGTADLGLIAYESTGPDGEVCPGMVLDEGIILELVHPGTGDPVAPGEVGEVVVTTLTPEYPLIRFATGDLSALLAGPSPWPDQSPHQGWLGRADPTTKVRGMFGTRNRSPKSFAGTNHHSRPAGHRTAGQRRPDDAAYRDGRAGRDGGRIAESAQSVTKLRTEVTRVPEGSLPNDGKVIEDRRPIG